MLLDDGRQTFDRPRLEHNRLCGNFVLNATRTFHPPSGQLDHIAWNFHCHDLPCDKHFGLEHIGTSIPFRKVISDEEQP
jgi:hypothetical protein